MANIVITSTTNTVKVDFGTYSSVLDGQEAGCYQKRDIDSIDGSAPSSNSDLYTKLIALIA